VLVLAGSLEVPEAGEPRLRVVPTLTTED
jgi:hypothetical protein